MFLIVINSDHDDDRVDYCDHVNNHIDFKLVLKSF